MTLEQRNQRKRLNLLSAQQILVTMITWGTQFQVEPITNQVLGGHGRQPKL